jgi:hypothetical protein
MSIQHRHNPELYAAELAADERAMQLQTLIGMPQVLLDMMAASDREYEARTAAGWELGEQGEWYAPDPETGDLILEWEWMDYGLSYPEDMQQATAR